MLKLLCPIHYFINLIFIEESKFFQLNDILGVNSLHQWINEIPTVPIYYYLAKPQPRERTWEDQRGKKTLLSLTLVSYCGRASLA